MKPLRTFVCLTVLPAALFGQGSWARRSRAAAYRYLADLQRRLSGRRYSAVENHYL